MQYVFLIYARALAVRNRAYVTRRSRVTYFLPPARERISKTRTALLHGQETVSIFIANLHAIFNDILRKKNMGLSFITTVSESVDGACS